LGDTAATAVRFTATGGVALMCTPTGGGGLVHYGLLHPPSAEVADLVTPLIAERLARREPGACQMVCVQDHPSLRE
jgi:hypothetical protein